ncbi:uncharacterized protein B0P05DRAFT_471981 [Gilbertella persicaria]|uniref:uncharacterized protein n=1 Tax=Gilbertella persicaria TaxID=101096 RepID=UPI00221F52F1|nr:uncharacterized protein B0P05DRAFT_471981 [Gilbertella persicaria]KAI8076501.1 hypothetical protein B0P05DRAFT_471981 [Gilbertella persicaria]
MNQVRWLYSSGKDWNCFDIKTQQLIEKLWCTNQASWIDSEAFQEPIYVDTALMTLMCGGYSYTIARLRH